MLSKKLIIFFILALFSFTANNILLFRNGSDFHIPVAKTTVLAILQELLIQQRISVAGYNRSNFGPAWTDASGVFASNNGCSTREDVLYRDIKSAITTTVGSCNHVVVAGKLLDPYSGRLLWFQNGWQKRQIEIDHIVPLAYAWDMGASNWEYLNRINFANDLDNLVAVSAQANRQKSDGGLGDWLPQNSKIVCVYIWQFVLMLVKYKLNIDFAAAQVVQNKLPKCSFAGV